MNREIGGKRKAGGKAIPAKPAQAGSSSSSESDDAAAPAAAPAQKKPKPAENLTKSDKTLAQQAADEVEALPHEEPARKLVNQPIQALLLPKLHLQKLLLQPTISGTISGTNTISGTISGASAQVIALT